MNKHNFKLDSLSNLTMENIMKEAIIEIDQDSFSCYLLIWSCQMISSSTGLPDNIGFVMLMFFHKLVPIHLVNAVFVNSMNGDYVRLNLSKVFLHKNLFPNLK